MSSKEKLSDKIFAVNVMWNFLGQAIPLAIGLLSIPFLISNLNLERFGILALAWVFIGYFNFLDFGIGKALTKLISERIDKRNNEIKQIISSGLTLMLLLGITGGLLVITSIDFITHDVLSISKDLLEESSSSFLVLAFGIPVVVLSIGLCGILEAYLEFKVISRVRVLLGILIFIGPLISSYFSHNLVNIMIIIVLSRLVVLAIYFFYCKKITSNFTLYFGLDWALVPEILRFGGWMTVSNIISPLMTYMDRFFIGSIMSVVIVSYYTPPYELVTKGLIIPGAIMGVFFPMIARLWSEDKALVESKYNNLLIVMFCVMAPLMSGLSLLAPEILYVWLGDVFKENSTDIMRVLALGVLINALAYVPYFFLQSIGRPDVTAKIHLIELPLYVALLLYLISEYGVVGAAYAWFMRVSFDFLALSFFVGRFLKGTGKHVLAVCVLIVTLLSSVDLLSVTYSVEVRFSSAVILICIMYFLVYLKSPLRSS